MGGWLDWTPWYILQYQRYMYNIHHATSETKTTPIECAKESHVCVCVGTKKEMKLDQTT